MPCWAHDRHRRRPVVLARRGVPRVRGGDDVGAHVVCVVLTDEFLAFSKSRGNDLSTPAPEYGFAGLTAGDRWCLCASRWREAYDAGCAPDVVLEATHARMLEWATVDELRGTAG